MRKEQHVVPNGKGGWDVKQAGAARASRHFDTQAEAISYGREVAKNQQAELFTHGRDGRIRQRDSYGNDPCPPKDKD